MTFFGGGATYVFEGETEPAKWATDWGSLYNIQPWRNQDLLLGGAQNHSNHFLVRDDQVFIYRRKKQEGVKAFPPLEAGNGGVTPGNFLELDFAVDEF